MMGILITFFLSIPCSAGSQGNLTIIYNDGSNQTMNLNQPPSSIKAVNISSASNVQGSVPNIAGQWKEVGGGCTGTIWNVVQVGEQVVSISGIGQCTGGTFQVWDGTNFQWTSGSVLTFKAIYKQNPWGWRENNVRVTFLSNDKARFDWRSDTGNSGVVGLEK
ncbi:MAG: hypothetical protein ABSG75_17680 [Syntrophales bacterium]|jgi:hypothetical protein